jgi:1-phosphofructokinase
MNEMIYTVTFNPSLDYIVRLDSFTAGEINRVNYEQVLAGGKGINVSIVLQNLGQKSTALGFLAGFTGEEIKSQLSGFGVKSDFVQLKNGFSRINVKAKAESETEINGQGPDISEAEREQLFQQLDKLTADDTLVLAGSIPKTLPDDIYQKIMARLDGKGIRIIVDAEKKLLLNVLQYHPFLIKPNNHELGDMFGVTLTSDEEILTYARKLQEKGAQNVLISMAGDGAILLTADGKSYKSPAPKGKLINSVGAGDSMVAGFITGFTESNGNLEKAFHMGVATGSASAFSENLATRPEVEALLATIE